MNPEIRSSVKEPKTGYWWPMRPWLRWPARMIGILLLTFSALKALNEHEWRLSAFGTGLAMLLWSYSRPKRRKEGMATSSVSRALASLAVIMSAAASSYMAYTHSNAYLRNAAEDRSALWMAAAKGFEGPLVYAGSEADMSFFRTGLILCGRYKEPTNKMALPKTFPLGSEEPYRVTLEMVPRSP